MTNSEVRRKLWIIKFCLKVIYPKYNNLLFLAYLAVRYRLLYLKIKSGYNMNKFELKNTSSHIQQLLLKDHKSKNKLSFGHQCIIISRRQFIDLASENLFYLDNGALWVNVRLSSNMKKKYKELKNNENKEKLMKYDLKFLTSEVHQKLWGKLSTHSLEKGRILPVIGSKYVQENVALATENEVHNIVSSMGIVSTCDIEITFHPVPSFDCAPQIAAAAEVSLIVNDFDLENDFLKEVLSNHFEVPKLMHVGDIFSIELLPEITTKHHYKYLDLVHSIGKLYFKCRNLDQKQAAGDKDKNQQDQILRKRIGNLDLPYFIVKGVTHLTLGENIHDMKPKDEYLSLHGNTKEMQFLSHCPNGLKQKFDQIQESILPFLSGRLNDFMSCLTSPIIPMFLLTGSTGSGRHLLVKTLAKYNGMNCLQLDCNAIQSSTAKQTESKISATIQKAKAASPVVVLLDNFEVFGVDAENNEDCRVIEFFINSLTELYENYKKHTILFIAVTEKTELKAGVMRIFLEKFHIAKLNLQQRYEMLQWFASAMQLKVDEIDKTPQENEGKTIVLYDTNNLPKSDVLQRVAAKAETFLYGDMDTLVHFAMRESYLKQYNNPTKSLPDPNLHLIHEDEFNSALESMRSLQSQHLDAPKIPKVYWEDIGGLDKLKKELLKTIEFPIKYPHLFKNSSLKRSGILMYGPPGCGKTLVAKAVSTELNVSFLSVKGPELLNMYIGQSEENVRKVFESARAASPCIVFLDELDSLAPRRGAAGDSGGASDRVVSQLLAELDGVSADDDADSSSLVFVMGATNRPDLLEQSLLRPGRLDKLVYVGPYCGPAEKTRVLTALCRKYKLGPEVSLPAVAEALPPRCTGADLLHVVSTARSAAVRALVAALQAGAIKESELSPDSIILGAADFLQGVNTFRPSVTDEDLAYYESLQSQM